MVENTNLMKLKLLRRRLEFVCQISIVYFVSKFENMEKLSYHYMMQFFHLKGHSPTNIKTELDNILEESAFSYTRSYKLPTRTLHVSYFKKF